VKKSAVAIAYAVYQLAMSDDMLPRSRRTRCHARRRRRRQVADRTDGFPLLGGNNILDVPEI
jgi:hypothetical protein